MIGSIEFNGMLVTRDRATAGCAPVKIDFREPISDESLRSLAAFAYGIEQGEIETMRLLGIEPLPVEHGDCGASSEEEARERLGLRRKEG